MEKRKYRKKGMAVLLLTSLVITGCAGCSGNKGTAQQKVTGLDKLGEIHVISREEGSGTRNTFAELAGFKDNNSRNTDNTLDGAEIVEDTSSVLNTVGSDPSAIGYGSAGVMVSDSQIKVLSVEGTAAGKKEARYPLSRSFYLVWNGKLTSVEEEFLRYIRSAGQEIVGQSYVTVSKQNSFLSLKPKGKITIAGSTSVGPLLECLAEEYMKLNPKASIKITQTDSGDGINQTIQGKCDMGMSSRELRDPEKELLNYEVIARDEIAVIVNAANPLKDITMDQLEAIYTGKTTEWKDIYN